MGTKQKRKLARVVAELARTKKKSIRAPKSSEPPRCVQNLSETGGSYVVSYKSFLDAIQELPVTGRASRMPMFGVKVAVFSSPDIIESPFDLGQDASDRCVKVIEFLPKRVVVPSFGPRNRNSFGWQIPSGIILVDMEPRL